MLFRSGAVAATAGRLWVLGGYPSSYLAAGLQDAWWSEDGRNWWPDTSGIPWGSRWGAQAVGFQDRVWLIGGASGSAMMNDVWYASGSFPPVNLSGAGSSNLGLVAGVTNFSYGTVLSAAQLGLSNNVPGTYQLSPAVGSVLGAGTQGVSVVFTPTDPSYGAVTGQVRVVVTPAVLVVRADDKVRAYGGVTPALTYSVAGFVNGESLATSGLVGSPVLNTGATLNSAVGTYPITVAVGGMSVGNYVVSGVSGALTVLKAPLQVVADNQARFVGTTSWQLTYTVRGFVNGEDLGTIGLGGSPVLGTTATAGSGMGRDRKSTRLNSSHG